MKWTFTPDEFAFVWRETGLDRFPSPLEIITTARTEDAAAQQVKEAKRKFPPRENPELSVALHVAAHPSTYVKIVNEPIRIAGSALNGTAVVLVQADNMIHVSLTRETELTKAVTDAVPNQNPGRSAAMSASSAKILGEGPTEVLVDSSRRSVIGPMRALLQAARSGEGHVAVHRFADNEFPPKPRYLSWIDVAGDGRYLVRNGTEIGIAPATRADLQTEIDKLVGRRT